MTPSCSDAEMGHVKTLGTQAQVEAASLTGNLVRTHPSTAISNSTGGNMLVTLH